jgi:GxxExxY protein
MLYEEALTEQIIGALIEVHRSQGPGLLESAYQACSAREFSLRQMPFEQEKTLPVEYKSVRDDCGYRLDFIVAGKIIVELKTEESLQPVHEAQLLTYLRLTGCKVGLLVNFNVPVLKHGIKRMAL